MSISIAEQAAEILVSARRNKVTIADLPENLVPQTLDDAYAIQDNISALTGPVGGWKVSVGQNGEPPKVTPVAAVHVWNQQSDLPAFGPVRVEVEFAAVFGRDLPSKPAPYAPDEVKAAIASTHVVFEILGTRFENRELISKLSYLADGNGNDAIVIGDAIADWEALDLSRLNVTLEANGAIIATNTAGMKFDHMLGLLTFLANHAAEHQGGIKAGQIVITGARIGPLTIEPETSLMGSINAAANVRVRIMPK